MKKDPCFVIEYGFFFLSPILLPIHVPHQPIFVGTGGVKSRVLSVLLQLVLFPNNCL